MFANENVAVASSNPLCPVTSLIGADNGVVSAFGVEVTKASVNSLVVGLVGPSFVGPLVDPVASEVIVLVSENLDVCMVISDNPEPEVCLDPSTVLEGAGCFIVASPIVIEKSPIDFVYGDNRVEELEGHCMNARHSVLGVTAEISPVNDLDSPVGAFLPSPLVDVPISLISNVAMLAHLASKLKDCHVDHSN
ncbi:hypothetical protein M5K25_000242 [Dendrobium thyrsiflorum]|uniref:Uncharacterized protein n=1 Tax=Dendrobium thyrsiflorum TaxID=117978 RepID=A0ABD0VTV0_DENTH